MSNIEISSHLYAGVGYKFQGGDTVKIDSGMTVSSETTAAVDNSNFGGAALYNFGSISSHTHDGVLFGAAADDGLIYNERGSFINSGNYGVEVEALGDSVNNYGTISGTNDGVVLGLTSSHAALFNYGTITSDYLNGVTAVSTVDGGSIYNSGLIRAGYNGIGIDVDVSNNLTTSITNTRAGVIEGVQVDGGAVSLNNHGVIADGVTISGDGNNVIVNAGQIGGMGVDFSTSYGNNVYEGAHGRLVGSDPYFMCGNGNDKIVLGKGKVFVSIGTGTATITAGSGQEYFSFGDNQGHVDHILKFKPGLDHIGLSQSAFLDAIGPAANWPGDPLRANQFHIGAQAATHSEHIIYNPHNGFLSYDADGSGPQQAVHFATLSPHLALTHGDFIVWP
jgi:hypothetical protein